MRTRHIVDAIYIYMYIYINSCEHLVTALYCSFFIAVYLRSVLDEVHGSVPVRIRRVRFYIWFKRRFLGRWDSWASCHIYRTYWVYLCPCCKKYVEVKPEKEKKRKLGKYRTILYNLVYIVLLWFLFYLGYLGSWRFRTLCFRTIPRPRGLGWSDNHTYRDGCIFCSESKSVCFSRNIMANAH